jgi:pantothenate synthetase
LTAGVQDGPRVVAAMTAVIAQERLVDLDYAACVRADTLEPLVRIDETMPFRLLVAAQVGSVRLIDNLDPRLPVPLTLAGPEPVR